MWSNFTTHDKSWLSCHGKWFHLTSNFLHMTKLFVIYLSLDRVGINLNLLESTVWPHSSSNPSDEQMYPNSKCIQMLSKGPVSLQHLRPLACKSHKTSEICWCSVGLAPKPNCAGTQSVQCYTIPYVRKKKFLPLLWQYVWSHPEWQLLGGRGFYLQPMQCHLHIKERSEWARGSKA